MMALFGMVWLLKVRKHLRNCPHCRAHLRTCNDCKARTPSYGPSTSTEKDLLKDSSNESCHHECTSQTTSNEERDGITLDLVSHDPSAQENKNNQIKEKNEETEEDNKNRTHPVDQQGGTTTSCSSDDDDSPISKIPPPPPPTSIPRPEDIHKTKPRRKIPPTLPTQDPCDNLASSLASRVCNLYSHDCSNDNLALSLERRRSFVSSKGSNIGIIDSSNHLSTLPRNTSKGKFCYNKGHTHPFSCSTISISRSHSHLPDINFASEQNILNLPPPPHVNIGTHLMESRSHMSLNRSISADTRHATPYSCKNYNRSSIQPQEKSSSKGLPPLTLDPRLLPMDSLDGSYVGSDSSRSSKSTYSEPSGTSLPPPAAFNDGASNYLPHNPNFTNDPRHHWGPNASSCGRNYLYTQQLSTPKYNNGMWFVPTNSHTTTFFGPDYPHYDPSTVPGRDRRFHGRVQPPYPVHPHQPHSHLRHHPLHQHLLLHNPPRTHQSPSMGSVGLAHRKYHQGHFPAPADWSAAPPNVQTSSSYCALHGFPARKGKRCVSLKGQMVDGRLRSDGKYESSFSGFQS